MIEQPALVIRVDGPDAWARVGAVSGCALCDAGKGCGAGVFGRLLRRRPVELRLPNAIGARAGDPVRVGIPEAVFVRLALLLYGLPIAAALAGAAIGHYLGTMASASAGLLDLFAFAGGATGLVLTGFALRARRPNVNAGSVRLLERAPPGTVPACAQTDKTTGEVDP